MVYIVIMFWYGHYAGVSNNWEFKDKQAAEQFKTELERELKSVTGNSKVVVLPKGQ